MLLPPRSPDARMIRLIPTAAALILALATPAAAIPGGYGIPEGYGPPPAGGPPPGYGRPVRRLAPHEGRRAAYGHRPVRVRPVAYGETDGEVYEAWMPRETRLPIY